jgi:hypothetical protein
MKRVHKLCLALALAAGFVHPACADHLSETNWEQRTVLYLKVPDAALRTFLPPGWHAIPFDAGAGKGANVTLNLSEQLIAVDAAGQPIVGARGRGITFSARVENTESGKPEAMVLFGMTNGSDVPGPYGTHQFATIAHESSKSDAAAGHSIHERWRGSSATADLETEVTFVPERAVLSSVNQRTRSSVAPAFSREYRVNSVIEAALVSTTAPSSVSVKVHARGKPAVLFDKPGQVVAVVSIPIYRREIWLPD